MSQLAFDLDYRPPAGFVPLNVLIACECSGVVRDAFLARGHNAYSCDLKRDERGSNRHIVGDAREVVRDGTWDFLMVAHPPCTRLCNSGVRWLYGPPTKLESEFYTADEIAAYQLMKEEDRRRFMWDGLDKGAALFSDLWNADVPRIAVENPVMHKHAKERIRNYQKFAQSIQPHQFGHAESKRTCLWLKNLPKLTPTKIITEGIEHKVHMASPGPQRAAERSRFFTGIASAMAEQWGGLGRLH